MKALEIRAAQFDLRADPAKPNLLHGYAATFNTLSVDLGGFVERIVPGAFRRALTGNADIQALVYHDRRLILGCRNANTLRLSEDDVGLKFEVDVPDTTYGRDTLVSVSRRDVRGMSFGFLLFEAGDRFDIEDGQRVRTLTDIDLREITVTANPAYLDTSIAVRVAPEVLAHVRTLDPRPALDAARRLLPALEIN